MPKTTKRIAIAAGAGAIALGGVLLGTGAAQANPSDSDTCQPGTVSAKVSAVNVEQPNTEHFVLEFDAAPGQSCLLTGGPQHLRFHNAAGTLLGVDSRSTGSENVQVRVDDTHPAFVHLRAPHADLTGAPAASASFTMANSTSGIPFTIAWPSDVNGPVQVGSVTGGVH